MNIEDFKQNLQKLRGTKKNFIFSLSDGTDDLTFKRVEETLRVNIPDKTKEFYTLHNGFKTLNPDFELLPIEGWTSLENGKIHFATFDNNLKIYYKSSKINSANQWTINAYKSDYEITLSMSSFWSNKIWHWLKNERHIWTDEFWKE